MISTQAGVRGQRCQKHSDVRTKSLQSEGVSLRVQAEPGSSASHRPALSIQRATVRWQISAAAPVVMKTKRPMHQWQWHFLQRSTNPDSALPGFMLHVFITEEPSGDWPAATAPSCTRLRLIQPTVCSLRLVVSEDKQSQDSLGNIVCLDQTPAEISEIISHSKERRSPGTSGDRTNLLGPVFISSLLLSKRLMTNYQLALEIKVATLFLVVSRCKKSLPVRTGLKSHHITMVKGNLVCTHQYCLKLVNSDRK